ncbi:hypothetical protein BC828DRAFT_269994 [Blastocladiella britannica]|nr:hypothetical protein BC828DRAFT_269994 [Blastocladiella britannica]
MFNSGGNGHGQYGTGAYRGTTGSKPSPPPGLQPSSSDENVSLAALMDRFAPPPASAPLPAQPFSFALRVGTTPVAPSSAAQQPFSFRFGGGGATAGTAPSTPSSAPAYDPFAHLEPTATIVAPRPPTTSASATGSQPPQPPPIRAADALAAVMAKRRAEKAAAAATRAAQGRDAGPVMMVVPDPMVAVDGSGLDDSLAGDDRTLPAGAIMPPRRPHSAAAAAASTSSSLGGGSAQVSEYPLERPASAAPGTPGTPALGRSSLERGLGASAAGPRFHTPAATPMAMPLPGGGAPLVAARQDRFVMLQTPNTYLLFI